MEKIENQTKTVEGMKKSLNELSTKYDEVLSTLKTHENTMRELRKKSEDLEARLEQNTHEMIELRGAPSEAEMYSRRKNIEIHGIKQQRQEDVMKIVQDLASKLELPVPAPEKIEAVHRLMAREGKILPILVRFTERLSRDLWTDKRTTLRTEGVFINENLTRALRGLFWDAKNVAKEKSYKFVWMRN
ncbi:uncharacterized protein ISCGN_006251, partial [Ixodes scapularis]